MFEKLDSENDLGLARLDELDNLVCEEIVDLMESKLGMVRSDLAVDCVMFNAVVPNGNFEADSIVFKGILVEKLFIFDLKLSA